MKIAVVSDTHSRHATVSRVLAELQARNITTVIHCGDIEDPETVLFFRGLTTHFVFGNCDGDKSGCERRWPRPARSCTKTSAMSRSQAVSSPFFMATTNAYSTM